MSEKSLLPGMDLPRKATPPKRSHSSTFLLVLLLGTWAYQLDWLPSLKPLWTHHCAHDVEESLSYTVEQIALSRCPAQPPLMNKGKDWNPIEDTEFAELAARRMSQAVQVKTESYDNMPLDATDPIFDKHYAFSHFLETEYTQLYNDPIKHEYINTHAHLFTWEGSDKSLKPVILMAHTDTVPVLPATLADWTYPPFEGKITEDATPETPGRWIWGRGASDCKNQLLGIYNAVERLVSEGFQPERTILIANGFDEEVGGVRGAAALSEFITERYGPNSMEFVIDEGFSGVAQEYGATVASFGMAEKGSDLVSLMVDTPGGHSSVPPVHTGIGIMSILLEALESHPFEPELNPEGPYIKYLSCLADYAPDVPRDIKQDLKSPRNWNSLARRLSKADRRVNSFLATTQAIDIINGGVKANALPEHVEAAINHRISFTSSVNETLEHVANVIRPIATSMNFTISAFDGSPKTSRYHITLSTGLMGVLEPAPISPTDSESFKLMGGTVKAVFGEDVIVSPTGMYANTDTKHFWGLTKNIFRFTPTMVTPLSNEHTVDEKIPLNAHLNATRFFYKLISNTQGMGA